MIIMRVKTIIRMIMKMIVRMDLLLRRCYGSHAKAERAEEEGDSKQGPFDQHIPIGWLALGSDQSATCFTF